MADCRYRAKIDHTEKTIMTLFRVEYHVYEQKKMLFRFLLGIAIVFAGVFLSLPTWARAVLLLIGAWFIASLDFPSQLRADRTLEARKGVLPRMSYEFYEDELKISGEGAMSIPYKKLSRLVEDREYLFLFLSRESVCMLESDSLQPKEPDSFKTFVAEKTGLVWQREKSLLSIGLTDLILMYRDRKKK